MCRGSVLHAATLAEFTAFALYLRTWAFKKNIRGSVPGKAADVIWEAAPDEVLGQVEGSKAAQATEDTIRDRGQAVAGHVQGQQCGSCREAARQLVQCIVAGVHLAFSNKCQSSQTFLQASSLSPA